MENKIITAIDNVKATPNEITSAKDIILDMMQSADIKVNGSNPWDIQIHREDLFQRVFKQGSLGLGEAYMEKWWDCDRLDMLFEKILKARLNKKITLPFNFKLKLVLAKMINYQTKRGSKRVAEDHYDLGNDLFTYMLDKRMIYSCAYFKNTSNLDCAQEAKLELICQKLRLERGMSLLDIGCGWGGLAKYAAENYGVNVVGITISKEQCEYGKNYCKGLPIDIRLQDYRDVNEKFDRIVSVGMFEHVGHKNYVPFMKTVHQALKDDGLFLLHTIGNNEALPFINQWLTKYIFPNSALPSVSMLAKSAEKLFTMEDWHNFSAYYDNTLMAWDENFTNNWDKLKNKYDERFYRMWRYYLLSLAGAFRARTVQLWQVVFSKQGVIGGYVAPR